MPNARSRFAAAVSSSLALAAVTAIAQQQPLPGGRRGGPPPLPVIIPKPLVPSGDPVRSCESLKSVSLPDTTIETATVDQGDQTTPASCRVLATVTG